MESIVTAPAVVHLLKSAGSSNRQVSAAPLRAITRERLERALAAAGFRGVEAWGDYSRAAFDAPGTGDLVAVATRGGPGRKP